MRLGLSHPKILHTQIPVTLVLKEVLLKWIYICHPLLPEVFLFGVGFRFTNLCTVTNMCPVNEEIVSSLSPCCLPEVFMYGYQHVSGFRCVSGYREDCVLPFSRSLCARTFVCVRVGGSACSAVLSVCCTYLVAAALAPPQAAMAAAAAACSSSLLRSSVDATHKNYFSSFVPKASSSFVSSSSSSISSCSCLKGQPLLESRGGGGAVFVGMPVRRPFQVLAMAPPKPSGKAKKVIGIVKLALEAGKATPAPPVGPALGSKGVNIMAFCKEYNAKTADKPGYVIPVEITVFDDKSFTFVLKTPPASVLLLKAAGAEKGSKDPQLQKVGKVTIEQLQEIATEKLPDLNCTTVESAMRIVAGTAANMGIDVVPPLLEKKQKVIL